MEQPQLTPNQVVAYNLRAARQLRGLTQDRAAELLEPFLGERWSTAVFSAAERSVFGRRIRTFDADTVHAFARAFELPVGFFFLPPAAVDVVVGPHGARWSPATATEQIKLSSWVSAEMRDRLDALTRQLPADDRARLIRTAAAGDPGGMREREMIAAVAARLKAEVETLEALTADPSASSLPEYADVSGGDYVKDRVDIREAGRLTT